MSARRRTALVALAATLGIAIAAAITWGTSQLVSQHIGLASEPLTVGRRLLPPAAHTPARGAPPPRRTTTTSTSTSTSSAPMTTTPSSTPTQIPSAPPAAAPEPAPEPSVPETTHVEPPGSGSEGDGGGDSSSHRDD